MVVLTVVALRDPHDRHEGGIVSSEPTGAGRRVWAVLELLDRQLVDRDGRLVGKVDDVEFELPDDPDGLPCWVSALLVGSAPWRTTSAAMPVPPWPR